MSVQKCSSKTLTEMSCYIICHILQDFKDCMQSPEMSLCGKDVNLLLGQVDSVDAVHYKTLAPKVFDLLAVRLSVCFSSTVHIEYT